MGTGTATGGTSTGTGAPYAFSTVNEYLGCNQAEANADGTGSRLFQPITGGNFVHSASTPVTQQTCRAFCRSTNPSVPQSPFAYFGIEFGINCLCGNSFQITRVQVDQSQRGTGAAGNPDQAGGGADRMSVWRYVAVSHLSSTPCSETVLCKHDILFNLG
jgi:hypothetical protein